jgi:hypothetical protein
MLRRKAVRFPYRIKQAMADTVIGSSRAGDALTADKDLMDARRFVSKILNEKGIPHNVFFGEKHVNRKFEGDLGDLRRPLQGTPYFGPGEKPGPYARSALIPFYMGAIGGPHAVYRLPEEFQAMPGYQLSDGIPDDFDMDNEEHWDKLMPKYQLMNPEESYIFTDRNKPGILEHEAGHLLNGKLLQNMFGTKGELISRVMSSALIPVAAGITGAVIARASPQASAEGMAAALIPLAGGIPNMTGEAVASLRGLNMIRKRKGLKAAIKASPRLAWALGTYSLPHVLSSAAVLLSNLAPRR